MARQPYETGVGDRLTFDLSKPGRMGCVLPEIDVPESDVPTELLRSDLKLPEMSQIDVVRYFTALSTLNYSIDTGFYPLGSCTMKYNPKVNDDIAALHGFSRVHPLQSERTAQGALEVLCRLQEALAALTGMNAVCLAPAAGAHGELSGILTVKAFLADRGETRHKVLVPDSAHGTNPATAAMCGFSVTSIRTDRRGNLDLDDLATQLDRDVAALMITMPNTLGLFEPDIVRVASMVHDAGALMYGDGANMNAIVGRARFADMGFDVVHMNLHKTFSTPHGGGGPGAGPIATTEVLADYLPTPVVGRDADGSFRLQAPAKSIGKVGMFHGNFGVLVRAYAFIRAHGLDGLRAVSENAVLNANYIKERLKEAYELPYDRTCLHEVVFSGSRQKANGVRTLDIAKRLIDYGFHPPTIYFPLIVDEALMIEPTESESLESLDAFCDAMLRIAEEATEDPDLVRTAPHYSPVRRLDEATAARKPILRWQPQAEDAPRASSSGGEGSPTW
ncbi:MAG TPA: aminomethyl-transferring glycine dehydrogenase subunit GcvPB [Dehalococcoidia bacterium]|nr:aminomethyl-transferring glycine dehydrogenase subunit GcvPB [Dehalococcoidia bacterium]